MGARFATTPDHLSVQPITGTQAVILNRLAAAAERGVGKGANRQWLWIPPAAQTRHALASHVEDRSRQSAAALRQKIPP
jgi:hypothetical protein